jgi:pyridoxamine 5'-phosphate oxidase
MNMSEINEIRKEYTYSQLEIDNLDTDPIVQFRYWLNDALKANVNEPTGMVLSTAGSDGKPSSRVVLLKNLDHDGFTFFSNYESRKGIQIQQNPNASLLFFWPQIERQVRIEGMVAKTPRQISDEYFQSRPEGSKIGAWASPQSRIVPNREYLDNLQKDYLTLFKSKPLERPENWGGYKLFPHTIEFWQGRENRLHDRFEYKLNGSIWEVNRLAP